MSEKPNNLLSNTDLPGGTVTFLFTDIEGSTQLLRRLRDQYTELLAQHHRLLRESFEKWQGRVVDTQGDAFFVAFPRATDAVEAVVEAQKALSERGWPGDETVRVRMGLHTGEPWLVEQGYVGMDVHRAARIAHAGHGEQVLLSEITAGLVQDDLPEGSSLLDLGKHQLKDMRRPERIQQLLIEDLPSDFPPLNSLSAQLPVAPNFPDGGVREPRQVGPSPYRGLAAFRQADAPFFFGREEFTNQLASSIRQQDLVAVIVGPSGSGKSSAVFAGLLPQLEQEGDWLVVSMRPGGRPFHALAAALLPLLDDTLSETDRLLEVEKLARAMNKGDLPLFHIIERILEQHPDAEHLLLVVDQFEELFTQRPDPDEQRQFLDELLAASVAGTDLKRPTVVISPLVVLLTLRADFMGQALAHRPFADALQEGSLMLGPMNRAELQAAVEKPAELQGAAFETGLIPRILDDVGEEPGNLPLLEFALSLLWERIDQGWLTHEAYDEIGRVDGALARYAEEVYDSLSPEHQLAAQRIFIQLVQPGEGTEDTRRVARKNELGEGNWPMIQHLADKRLVVTGRDAAGQETVEIVHEALIRSWERLREWIEEDRAFRVWQEGLRASMRQWQASEQDEGGLLRGAPLVTAEMWSNERGSELSLAEWDFINTSIVYRASQEKRRERRRRWIMAGLATGLVVALVLLAVAFNQNNIARQEVQARATAQANAELETQARATAQAQAEAAKQDALTQASIGLASQVVQELEGGYPERAVPLALEALENYPYTWQAERALGQAVFENHLRQVLIHEGGLTSAFWSPDGTRILTATDTTARIWDTETGEELAILQPDGNVGVALWSSAGDSVWTYGDQAVMWDPVTGEQLLALTGHENWVESMSWSPSGDRILTTSADQTARIWEAMSGEELTIFTGHGDGVFSCNGNNCAMGSSAWSPDGKRVLTSDMSGEVFIWDPTTGQELIQLSGHTDWVNASVWSPDGARVATASDDGTARIWDATTGDELLSYSGPVGVIYAFWSPDGKKVLLTFDSGDPAVMLDTSTGDEIFNFREHKNKILWAEWNDDGSKIVSSDESGVTHIWDSASGEVLQEFPGHAGWINLVRWSPTYNQIVTASDDGTAKVWDVDDQLTIREIPGDDIAFRNAWWFPSGDRIHRAYLDGSVRVLDAATGHELLSTQTQEGNLLNRGILRTDVSPSGQEILAVYWGGTARISDARTGDLLVELSRESETDLYEGEWSPDGSRFAIGWVDGVIQISDARTGEELLSFDGHPKGQIICTRWSPDSLRLATTDLHGDIKVWDAKSGDLLLDLNPSGSSFSTTALSWSQDGEQLAAHRDDGILTIWDANTGEVLQTMTGHENSVTSINWFPNQDRILTGDDGGEIKVWEVESGREVASFTFPGSYMADLSPDGHQVLATEIFGPLTIIDIWQSRDELVELAKDCCLFRELTDLEREQFGLPPISETE